MVEMDMVYGYVVSFQILKLEVRCKHYKKSKLSILQSHLSS